MQQSELLLEEGASVFGEADGGMGDLEEGERVDASETSGRFFVLLLLCE